MKEQIRCILFTVQMDREISQNDLADFGSCRFCFQLDDGTDVSLLFEDLEVMVDVSDLSKVYCHGLKPVWEHDTVSEKLSRIRAVSLKFIPRESSSNRIPAGILRIQNGILEAGGNGTAPDVSATPYVELSAVQGLNTYTVFCRFLDPLLHTYTKKEK